VFHIALNGQAKAAYNYPQQPLVGSALPSDSRIAASNAAAGDVINRIKKTGKISLLIFI